MPAPSRPIRYKSRKDLAPPLGQLESLQHSAAAQSLFGNFRNDMALLRLQMRQARADRKFGVQEAREQGRINVAASAGNALERGVVGGTSDIIARQRARDDQRAAVQGIRSQFTQTSLANLAQQMQSRQEYETGLLNLLAMKKATRSSKAIDDFFQGILDSYSGGGGGSGGFGGSGGGAPGGGLEGRIDDKRKEIFKVLRMLGSPDGSTPDAMQGNIDSYKTQLRELWKERNKLRGRAGMDPLSRKRLRKLIRQTLYPSRSNASGQTPGPMGA